MCYPTRVEIERVARGSVPQYHPVQTVLPTVDPDVYFDRVEIARGGICRIVAARDRRLGRAVALKELRVDNPHLHDGFMREALLTARLQHPAIIAVHEAGCWTNGEPFFAMTLAPGRSLDQLIAATPTLAGRLALLPHLFAVADAIAHAHGQRIIHRDLVPRNVLVGELGETYVIDWGLARDITDPDDERMDTRDDVHAIGAMLHLLIAGVPATGAPLDGAGVPDELRAIVTRAMARSFADARVLAEELRRFQSGQLVGQATWRRLMRKLTTRSRTAC